MRLDGFSDLLGSERGVFCILALGGALALAMLGRIDGAQALDFIKWLTGALVLSKTITNAVTTHTTKQSQAPGPSVPAAKTVRDDLEL